MTTEERQKLRLFETHVRQLIIKHKALEQEVQELRVMVDERNEKIEALTLDNELWQKKYNDLKVAKMIDISSEESENAQKRIARLIREIDKCIKSVALINA